MSRKNLVRKIESDLRKAVETNSSRLTRRILLEGARVDEINTFRDTPLMTSIFHNSGNAAKIFSPKEFKLRLRQN